VVSVSDAAALAALSPGCGPRFRSEALSVARARMHALLHRWPAIDGWRAAPVVWRFGCAY
jgi:hypothetical protein